MVDPRLLRDLLLGERRQSLVHQRLLGAGHHGLPAQQPVQTGIPTAGPAPTGHRRPLAAGLGSGGQPPVPGGRPGQGAVGLEGGLAAGAVAARGHPVEQQPAAAAAATG